MALLREVTESLLRDFKWKLPKVYCGKLPKSYCGLRSTDLPVQPGKKLILLSMAESLLLVTSLLTESVQLVLPQYTGLPVSEPERRNCSVTAGKKVDGLRHTRTYSCKSGPRELTAGSAYK